MSGPARRRWRCSPRPERRRASTPRAGAPSPSPRPSSRTLVYKGMLMATQLREYFPDLSDPRLISALCMYHSRFSTNTFPSLRLAHPRPRAWVMFTREAGEGQEWMSAEKKAFYDYHSCLMEPGDGPASIVFTDG